MFPLCRESFMELSGYSLVITNIRNINELEIYQKPTLIKTILFFEITTYQRNDGLHQVL